MNRKSLSIIAAIGLSLSNASQITAGNSASVIAVGTLATAAGVSHYRGAQIQRYEQEQAKLQIIERNKPGLFSKMIEQTSDIVRRYTFNHYPYGLGIKKENISIPQLTATWRVYFVSPTLLVNVDMVDETKATILTGSMIEPENTDDYLAHWTKNNDEKERLLRLAKVIVEGRLDQNCNPITGEEYK